MPNKATETLRLLAAQRTQLVQQMTRAKNGSTASFTPSDPTLSSRAVQCGRQDLAEDAILGLG